MKKIFLFLGAVLFSLGVSATTYDVTITSFNVDLSGDNNIEFTNQLNGATLTAGDSVNLTLKGYFDAPAIVTYNTIADNAADACGAGTSCYWNQLTDYETEVLGTAVIGEEFNVTKIIEITTTANSNEKYIVQLSFGFSSLKDKMKYPQFKFRPTEAALLGESKTYEVTVPTLTFGSDGGSNYNATVLFETDAAMLMDDILKVKFNGKFNQDINSLVFMVFDNDGNEVLGWSVKGDFQAAADETVDGIVELVMPKDCPTTAGILRIFVEGYDENVILKFTTADDAQYVKVFSLPYNVYGERVDDDNISDQWSTKNSVEYNLELTNAVIDATGNTSWSPSVGEKFVVTMSGAANFSGTMKVRIVDTREAVSYWGELTSSNIEETTVSEGEDFSIEKVLTIIKDTKDGVSLTSPQLYIECFPTLTSTMEGFDNTKVMKLNLSEYSVTYQPAPTYARVFETSYTEFSADRDEDGESDDWQGSFNQEFIDATGLSSYTPAFGDSFTFKMQGFANFTGEMAFYMVDNSSEAGYWLQFAEDVDIVQVIEGEEYSIERTMFVSRTKKDGYTLKNPHFIIMCYPNVTSSMYGFSTEDKKIFYATEYSMEYTPANFVKTLGLSYNSYGKDTDEDNISDEWQGKYPNEFLNAVVEANGNTAWKPSLGEKFTITMEGFTDFTGDLSLNMVDIREDVEYWAPFADYEDSFRVKKGTAFSVQRVIEVTYLDKHGITLQDPYFVIGCDADVTSTKSNFDEGETKHLYLTKYEFEYGDFSPINEDDIIKTFETSYADWADADDIDNDGVSDRWEEKFDEFTIAAGYEEDTEWQPAIGDKFILKMSGTANFTGYVQLYMADVRQEVNWFKEFSTAPERIYVKEGDRFVIEREFVVKDIMTGNTEMLSPKLYMVCVGQPTSSQAGFDNTIKKTLSLIKYEMKYVPFVQELIATWDSYTSNDTDLDGISDLWNGNKNVFDHYNNIGDSYEFQMSGISDFTGTVKFWMINWGSNGQTWNEIAQNPSPTFNVTEGEEYNFTWTFSVTEDEWELGKGAATVLHYQFMPSTTSTKEGFDNSAEMKLFVNKYSQTYTPVETVQAGYSYLYNLYSDTLKIYLPDSEVLSSTYGSPITYEITSSNTSVPAYISNDTLYIKSIEDDRSKNIEIKLKGTIENGSSAMGTITVFAQDAYWEWRSVRANDTLALYVPNEYLFSRAHVIAEEITSYQVLYEETDVPLYFSNDTLYAMPTKDHIDKTIYVVIKGRCDNGSVIGEKLALYIEHDSIVPNPQIALVTVSETSGKNLVVWQKFDTDKIDHYNIYREGEVAGKYEKIAEVPYSEISVYEDLEADPIVQPWRYGITATPTDDRYSETEMISVHKTLHLQQNQGLGGVINLSWNEYKGVDYSTYKIIRKSVVRKEVIIDTIATVPSNLTTYTDIEPAKGTQAYYVAIELPQTIDPNVLLKSENGPFSLAISNIAEVESDPTAVANVIDEKVEIRVTGRVITILNAENGAKVYDVSGRFVAASDVAPVQQVEVAKAGVYFVKIGDNVFKVVLN